MKTISENPEKRKYKIKQDDFELGDLVDRLPNCGEALEYLQDYRRSKKCGISTDEWLRKNPAAAKWALKEGFITEREKIHNWDNLYLERSVYKKGQFFLKQDKRILLVFKPNGEVYNMTCSKGDSGHFDALGRLIINTEG
ncbi:MAG: hypothetical protein GY841_14165 [FCB group bacterium]|nr:hypothetical protein [FCB group bacterium]